MDLWTTEQIGPWEPKALNVDAPEFVQDVMGEISGGEVDVYYDTRWETSRLFAEWLLTQGDLLADRDVLVLGCGIGLEALSVARVARTTYCNDLSPVACRWCLRQLTANGLSGEALVGSYLEIEVPPVDVVVGSFLVYNDETAASLAGFVQKHDADAVFANDPMPYWYTFQDALPDRRVEQFPGENFVMARMVRA